MEQIHISVAVLADIGWFASQRGVIWPKLPIQGFRITRPRACMHGGSVSCIRKISLTRTFSQRSLRHFFRRRSSIAHLPQRLCHGSNESPSFQNGYLACINSKWRSETNSSKPVRFYTRIVHSLVYSGLHEASVTKQLPGSLEDLDTFQALLSFFAPSAFLMHRKKAHIYTYEIFSNFRSCWRWHTPTGRTLS